MATTLSGLENQTKVITMNALGEYDNLRPQVKPVEATYAQMLTMRNQGKLIPGQLYRITDYVTTVNEPTVTNARSAGHPFDIIVMALDATTLSEEAWAIQHDGDDYFANSNLAAWKLRYTLDNIQWTLQVGTYLSDEENGYSFMAVGTANIDGHTYQLLKGLGNFADDWSEYAVVDSLEEGQTYYAYYAEDEVIEEVGTISSVNVVDVPGKGTITWMKDEFENECPYDFKNVQFKRYMTTDSVSGREGLDGKYIIADPYNCPQGLSVEDTEDFIWAFTFSSDNAGGEQTDYSLTAAHEVHDNVMKPYIGGLPNNVMFGEYNYSNSFGFNCHDNSWGNNCHDNSCGNNFYANSWGNECYYNSLGTYCQKNSLGNYCQNNSWGKGCSHNSLGHRSYNNTWGNSCYANSLGNEFNYNSWGNECYNNSLGNNCYNNSWGNKCHDNSWGNFVMQNTLFEGVFHTQITTENVQNVQVLNGVAGTSSSKLTLTFAANKTYTQVAAKTSAGVLKIYVPGDLA